MNGTKNRIRISFNSPTVLGFALICLAVQVLGELTHQASTRALFSVYGSSPANPLTYLRLVGHVFGHADWTHLLNNMMYILILGPLLEEKYGSLNLLFVMAATALVTGVIHVIFFPNVHLLGASGIVFAFILLASITSAEERTIPFTFLLVAVLYIGKQIYEGVTSQDNISQLTHIVGGVVGSVLGFVMRKYKMSRYQR